LCLRGMSEFQLSPARKKLLHKSSRQLPGFDGLDNCYVL
jgi:hypothetical protein